MDCKAFVVTLVLTQVLSVWHSGALANEDTHPMPEFSRSGADTCLGCHEEKSTMAIFDTPHAVASDPRTPFAQQQCESCHGPGGDHGRRLRPGQERAAPMAFAANAVLSTADEVTICLSCHKTQERMHWQGSEHERAGIGCVDCHSVHASHDPATNRNQQAGMCFDCHTRERAESLQASSHPIQHGQMVCTDCHQPHGTLSDNLLLHASKNDNCFQCHAEKRGPFLWEHAPAAEDCTLCHNAHGSNHPDLLSRRAPLLCQECHSRAGHPSIAQTGERLPDGRPSAMLLGASCNNCHSQVHGSNHPSGANLSR